MTDPKQTVDVKDLISRYRQGSSGLKRESESTNRNIEPSGSKNARKEKEKAWETNAESGEEETERGKNKACEPSSARGDTASSNDDDSWNNNHDYRHQSQTSKKLSPRVTAHESGKCDEEGAKARKETDGNRNTEESAQRIRHPSSGTSDDEQEDWEKVAVGEIASNIHDIGKGTAKGKKEDSKNIACHESDEERTSDDEESHSDFDKVEDAEIQSSSTDFHISPGKKEVCSDSNQDSEAEEELKASSQHDSKTRRSHGSPSVSVSNISKESIKVEDVEGEAEGDHVVAETKFERGDSNEEYHIHEHELVSPVHIQTSMLSYPATNSHSQQNGHTQLEDSLQSPQEEQDYTDFDLSEIQGSGQLDIGFNKQKLLLVQKGSIANRRKPSRTSVRTASDASNGTEHIDSVVVGDKGEMGNVNGHSEVLEEEAPSSPPPIPSSSPPTSPPRSPRGQGPVLRTGKQIVGVKTAIVLPGLADLGKTKLKSVTSPESKESATPEKRSTDKEESPFWLTNLQKNPRVIPPTLSPGSPEKEKEETPSWLVKLQKKPKVLPPSFSSEKSPAEKEAEETPSWVANHPKKPRALPRSLNPGKAASEQKKDDTPSWLANLQKKPRVLPPSGNPEKKPVEQEEPEWVKQALSKKHKVPIPVPKEPEKKDSEPTIAPWMKERMNRRSLVSPLQAINTTNVSSTSVLTDFSPKDISDSASVSPEDTMDSSLSSSPQRKDLLTPLSHKLSVEHGEPMDQDENSPPSHSSVSSLPPRSVLPPLDKTPSTKSLSETDEENVPAWKKEIAERRKSKVFIPTQRPEKPLTLGEIPQWKKELAEKSKHRKDTFDRTPDVTPSKENSTESVSPWQQEMAQKKMRPISKALEPKEKARTEDPVPEWMKQVQQRRQRLAESGLIKKQSHGQSNT